MENLFTVLRNIGDVVVAYFEVIIPEILDRLRKHDIRFQAYR